MAVEYLTAISTGQWCAWLFVVGLAVGVALVKPIICLADDRPLRTSLNCGGCGEAWPWGVGITVFRCSGCRTRIPWWYVLLPLFTACVFGSFAFAYFAWNCQAIVKVSPDPVWYYGRFFYHLTLIILLLAATGTDLREYVIPDSVTATGAVIGCGMATISGDLQMVHLWIDWNREQVLVGAYIPRWIAEHRHLHGLAWSLVGAVFAGGMTWLLRVVASRVLGTEALGFGDVTLMAMIGSFLGWQPIVFVFLLAPFCGLVAAGVTAFAGQRTFIPFGPYLSAATLVVLFAWKWLWEPLRDIFGHWPTLIAAVVATFLLLTILLILVRAYRTIPVEQTKRMRRQISKS